MPRRIATACLVIALLSAATAPTDAPRLPAFTHTSPAAWINAEPLAVDDLAGQVVMVDVWTYECWNCYRSIPWMLGLEKKYGARGFRIVGVHTPEFEREKVRANVEAKIKEFGIEHPVMLDNDFSYWNALGNKYWPAFYLVDRRGRVRGYFVGETHRGDKRANKMEALIERLMREPA